MTPNAVVSRRTVTRSPNCRSRRRRLASLRCGTRAERRPTTRRAEAPDHPVRRSGRLVPVGVPRVSASMNHVAEWANDNGLMDYVGDECIPPSASLLEAHIASDARRPPPTPRRLRRVARGAARGLRGPRRRTRGDRRPLARLRHLVRAHHDELAVLAEGVRPIVLGHLERIMIQGRRGLRCSSSTTATSRYSRTTERATASSRCSRRRLRWSANSPSCSTNRTPPCAVDEAVVLEIGACRLRPLVEARPQVLDSLTALLEERRRDNASDLAKLRARIRRTIFTG